MHHLFILLGSALKKNKHTLFKKLDKNQENAKYRSNTSIAVCV